MKYNNERSYEALIKRGLICEVIHRVIQAYSDDGRALRYVSEALRMKALCKAAAERFVYTLCFVPGKLRTIELCVKVVKKELS
jgi:hypothetical protein